MKIKTKIQVGAHGGGWDANHNETLPMLEPTTTPSSKVG